MIPPEIRARSQCEGKAAYDKERKALQGAQRSADRWACQVFVYPCDICHHFHLSTSNKDPNGKGYPLPTAVVFPKVIPCPT